MLQYTIVYKAPCIYSDFASWHNGVTDTYVGMPTAEKKSHCVFFENNIQTLVRYLFDKCFESDATDMENSVSYTHIMGAIILTCAGVTHTLTFVVWQLHVWLITHVNSWHMPFYMPYRPVFWSHIRNSREHIMVYTCNTHHNNILKY